MATQPPKDTPFKPSELAVYNGTDSSKPIYVAIKGVIYDVSSKPEMYGAGSGYNCFAGKDASKALGKSSLKPEECVADYSSLDEKELETLNGWVNFFQQRYNVVGKVVDE
ncbi:cytochrome b5-like heme/steroid binding domain-containing protein [Umbelopsis sp. PMI_123]|nr:cytochrome b5-like heme/steroid binding domain-containing protein [Umbelopsis sp. PMI_123]